MNSSNWQFVFFRYFASFLFILSHSLLVLDHLPVGAALHGLGEVFIAPWAFRERAWDPFMNMSGEERVKNITINGSFVVAIDYAASEPNLLYQMMTGQRLFPDGDP